VLVLRLYSVYEGFRNVEGSQCFPQVVVADFIICFFLVKSYYGSVRLGDFGEVYNLFGKSDVIKDGSFWDKASLVWVDHRVN
jgi:hypothetical protein